jgi:hypothetical protein
MSAATRADRRRGAWHRRGDCTVVAFTRRVRTGVDLVEPAGDADVVGAPVAPAVVDAVGAQHPHVRSTRASAAPASAFLVQADGHVLASHQRPTRP